MMKRGLIILGIGLFFFYQGLDEIKDYLRFYHGIWHMFVGISSMYTWQIRYSNIEEFNFSNVLKYQIKN